MKLLTIIILLALSACTSAPTTESSSSNEKQPGLVPLAVGNTWKYMENNNEKTIIISSVEKSQSVNGVTWFLYNEMGDRFWVRNQGMEQYESYDSANMDSINFSNINEQLVLAKPDGKIKSYYVEQDLITYKPCLSPITVKAGTFECHTYTFDMGDGYYSISYYAKNIGVVLNKYNSNTGYSETELIEYNLK